LLNASVGVQRALDRLRPVPSQSPRARLLHRQSLALATAVRRLVRPDRVVDLDERSARADRPQRDSIQAAAIVARRIVPAGHRASGRPVLSARSASAGRAPIVARAGLGRRSLVARLGPDRAVPAAAIAILLVATAISSAPALTASGPIGGTTGAGEDTRIALGGVDAAVGGPDGLIDGPDGAGLGVIAADPDSRDGYGDYADPATDIAAEAGAIDDGTLLKPIAVDTSVSDGKGLMRTYKVRSGDTLTGIARKFGVTMMTVWWANHLRSKDDLHIGQTLTIPPVSGVVVTVSSSDTLETLAARYRVQPAQIIEANALDDPNLVIGQTLTIPGGRGAGIPVPTPAPTASRPASTSSSHSTVRPPSRYTGGKFHWPVAGGYISQYFHYGHYAIDIAADRGTPVLAAAAGTVIFAGWKSNGGGYQVWISHGSGLYTTYNHMSSVSVGRGQHVSRGQRVGRVGATGNATGPHLHFEVWRGPVWNGGVRVNPLIYL
jgi:murein DD-endopeptidase MepM/ murein hydrolase activator NlpD